MTRFLYSVVALLVVSPSPASAQHQGALAIAADDARYAFSLRSEADAINTCGTTACEVVATFSACIGVAYSQRDVVWSWAQAATRLEARRDALNECEGAGGTTCEGLGEICVDAPAAELAFELDRADRRRIQERLLSAGFDPGVADGLFGPRTRAAIQQWQAYRRAPATGYLNRAEVEALRGGDLDGGALAANGAAGSALQGVVRGVASTVTPPKPEHDIADERQAELSRILRRLAAALARPEGAHRPETESHDERKLARPGDGTPADSRQASEYGASARRQTHDAGAAATGFCGLAFDDPAYIVVRLDTNLLSEAIWHKCPNGPASGCNQLVIWENNGTDSDYYEEGARYATMLGGELHCEFTVRQSMRGGRLLRTLDFTVYKFDLSSPRVVELSNTLPENHFWYRNTARRAQSDVMEYFDVSPHDAQGGR